MLTKIATIVVVLTLALGGAGIIAASAQGDGGGHHDAASTKTALSAKFSGDETRETPLQLKSFTQTAARSGAVLQDPFEFQFGTAVEFVPGNPWKENDEGANDVAGFGLGGRESLAKKAGGGAGKAAKP